jgi:replicative DNA helicase
VDSSFKETLEQIEENRRKEWVGIPMDLGILDRVAPYIERKRYILLFGASGVGKSRFTKKQFLIHPFLFSRKTGYKIKVIYFSLEEPKHDIMTQLISHFYAIKYGEKHAKEFFSRDKPSDEVMQRVAALEEMFLHFSDMVDIVDSISNPTGLLKYVDDYHSENGKFIQLSPYKK